jgi:hypothetical protein
MSHPKNPSAQILPRSSFLQVLKQGQKNFLDHFFAILRGKAESQQVAHQPASQLVKQLDDFLLMSGWGERALGLSARRKFPPRHRVWFRHPKTSSQLYILASVVLFALFYEQEAAPGNI